MASMNVEHTYIYHRMKYVLIYINNVRGIALVTDAESERYYFAFPLEKFMEDAVML